MSIVNEKRTHDRPIIERYRSDREGHLASLARVKMNACRGKQSALSSQGERRDVHAAATFTTEGLHRKEDVAATAFAAEQGRVIRRARRSLPAKQGRL